MWIRSHALRCEEQCLLPVPTESLLKPSSDGSLAAPSHAVRRGQMDSCVRILVLRVSFMASQDCWCVMTPLRHHIRAGLEGRRSVAYNSRRHEWWLFSCLSVHGLVLWFLGRSLGFGTAIWRLWRIVVPSPYRDSRMKIWTLMSLIPLLSDNRSI